MQNKCIKQKVDGIMELRNLIHNALAALAIWTVVVSMFFARFQIFADCERILRRAILD